MVFNCGLDIKPRKDRETLLPFDQENQDSLVAWAVSKTECDKN